MNKQVETYASSWAMIVLLLVLVLLFIIFSVSHVNGFISEVIPCLTPEMYIKLHWQFVTEVSSKNAPNLEDDLSPNVVRCAQISTFMQPDCLAWWHSVIHSDRDQHSRLWRQPNNSHNNEESYFDDDWQNIHIRGPYRFVTGDDSCSNRNAFHTFGHKSVAFYYEIKI
jgi:hypothetical protein